MNSGMNDSIYTEEDAGSDSDGDIAFLTPSKFKLKTEGPHNFPVKRVWKNQDKDDAEQGEFSNVANEFNERNVEILRENAKLKKENTDLIEKLAFYLNKNDSKDSSSQTESNAVNATTLQVPPKNMKFSSPLAKRIRSTILHEAGELRAATEAFMQVDNHLHDAHSSLRELLSRINIIKADIGAMSHHTEHSDQLYESFSLVEGFEGYLLSLKDEVCSAALLSNEESFRNGLTEKFDIVNILKDGNCLFTAAYLFAKAKGLLHVAEPESIEKGSMLIRHKSNRYIYDNYTDLKDSIISVLLTALNCVNQTDVLIHDALCSMFPNEDLRTVVNRLDEKVVEVFCNVMDINGIFGERIHIEVLCKVLKVQICLYYNQKGIELNGGKDLDLLKSPYHGLSVKTQSKEENKDIDDGSEKHGREKKKKWTWKKLFKKKEKGFSVREPEDWENEHTKSKSKSKSTRTETLYTDSNPCEVFGREYELKFHLLHYVSSNHFDWMCEKG